MSEAGVEHPATQPAGRTGESSAPEAPLQPEAAARAGVRQARRPASVTFLRPARLIFPHALHTIRSLLMIVVVALFVLTFVMQPFRIPSESMERTLLVGDFLLVDKSTYGPAGHWGWLLPYKKVRDGDVIVFHFPLDPNEHVVKRVVGTSGDRIRLRRGVLYRNGEPIHEPYAVFENAYPDAYRDQFPARLYTDPGVDTHWWLQMRRDVVDNELVVPLDSYFAMGDNRNHSRDSRYWGYVPPENIVGRPLLIYFSVREPSATDSSSLPDDRLGKSALNRLLDFARWDRVLRVVH